jgi:hypothetical protein
MSKSQEAKYAQTSRIWSSLFRRAERNISPLPQVDATADLANSLAVHAGGDANAISWLAKWANRKIDKD